MSFSSLHTTNSSALCDWDELVDKETQTSQHLYSPILSFFSRKSLNSVKVPPDKKTPSKVFDYTDVLTHTENPYDVSVIKDIFTKGTIDKSNTSLNRSQTTHHLDTGFCKEVVKLVIESESKTSCPVKSDDDDKSDCQHIKEVYYGNEDLKEKNSLNHCNIKMDLKNSSNKSSCNLSSSTTKCHTINNESDGNYLEKDKCPDVDKVAIKDVELNAPNAASSEKTSGNICSKPDATVESDITKVKECLSKCIDLAVNHSSAYLQKVFGIQPTSEDKPTYYITSNQPPEDATENITPKISIQKLIQPANDTISNIKCAVQNFFGSMYKKTKDYAYVSESNEHPVSICVERSSSSSSKVHAENSKTASCTYSDFSGENTILSNIGSSLNTILPETIETVGKLGEKVESTLSYIGERTAKELLIGNIEPRISSSSPSETPSKQLQPTGMFETIKTKLFSIFKDHSAQDIDRDDSDESVIEDDSD